MGNAQNRKCPAVESKYASIKNEIIRGELLGPDEEGRMHFQPDPVHADWKSFIDPLICKFRGPGSGWFKLLPLEGKEFIPIWCVPQDVESDRRFKPIPAMWNGRRSFY